MGITRDYLLAQLRQLPPVPFMARLLDPRAHLTQLQRAQAPYLSNGQCFTVAEVVLDRCFEQPGIWVRAADSLLVLDLTGPHYSNCPSIWLNLAWCQVVSGAGSN